jgi:hypothetical protein
MTVKRRSFTSGHFELEIDGHKSTAYVKSVDGGHVKANTIDEPIGTHNQRIKSISTIDIEPFTVDFGFSAARDIFQWIQQSWNKRYSRRNGVITHANFDLQRTYEQEFFDALLTETTFPALDGAAKDTAYIKIKFQPEGVKERKVVPGSRVAATGGTKQKLWTANSFRFTIDGVPGTEYANKLESFTVKQNVKKMYCGEDRFARVEPTKLEFPNIVGTVGLDYADGLLKWHREFLARGQSEPAAQRSGALEFLAPDKDRVLFRIDLFEVGLNNVQVLQSQANQDAIKRVKFDLFVGRMFLDGAGFGMD